MEITNEKAKAHTRGTRMLAWWMRVTGSFYLFLFVGCAIVKKPIQVLAPEGTLELAASGDALARFLVDTWVILGLAIGSIGIALLVASRSPIKARALVGTVIGFETIWGLCSDFYQLSRGYAPEKIIPWIVIHLVIIGIGLVALQKTRFHELK